MLSAMRSHHGGMRAPHGVKWDAVAQGARDVARTLVPVHCPGCGAYDVPWCGDCAAPWWEPPYRAESSAGRLDIWDREPLPVWSIAPLAGPAHGMIAAWKDAGRRDLDAFFAQAIGRAAGEISSQLGNVPGMITVVPAPSRPTNTRRRGVDLPAMLAREVATALARASAAAVAKPCLEISGTHSRSLSARDRWRGARSGVRAREAPDLHRAALLVDDVLTTGATLAACVEALERAGWVVVAGLTLAATEEVSPAPSIGLR
jgi:predicted amidophosphoribosyltransferase